MLSDTFVSLRLILFSACVRIDSDAAKVVMRRLLRAINWQKRQSQSQVESRIGSEIAEIITHYRVPLGHANEPFN